LITLQIYSMNEFIKGEIQDLHRFRKVSNPLDISRHGYLICLSNMNSKYFWRFVHVFMHRVCKGRILNINVKEKLNFLSFQTPLKTERVNVIFHIDVTFRQRKINSCENNNKKFSISENLKNLVFFTLIF